MLPHTGHASRDRLQGEEGFRPAWQPGGNFPAGEVKFTRKTSNSCTQAVGEPAHEPDGERRAGKLSQQRIPLCMGHKRLESEMSGLFHGVLKAEESRQVA